MNISKSDILFLRHLRKRFLYFDIFQLSHQSIFVYFQFQIANCFYQILLFDFLFRLLVATQNGFLYVYDVSEVEGGDCKLIVKHNLRNVDTQPIKIQGKFRRY